MEPARGRKIVKYVVPTILSSCCFFLFTVIDGIFVGRGVGTDALGAVNLAMPFVMVVNALFMLATIGGVTIVAIRLGRKDTGGANQAFMHSFILGIIITVALTIIGTCLTGPLARLLGANETFYQMTYDYLFWYSIFLIPSGLGMLMQGFCRNDSAPVLVSVAVISSTVLNIFLDWVFIFPMQMGVAGAAIATGISQTASLAIMLTHFVRKRGRLRLSRFKIDKTLYRKITGRGLPEMIAQFATPVTTLCMNYVLISRIGNDAINAFSIISYVASFSVAIFFGTSEGLQPLFGQAYGAKNESDMKYFFRTGILINLIGSIVIFILLFFIGGPVGGLFGANEAATSLAATEMPKFAWSFILIALNTMISAYMYSTKRTKEAIILNVCRGLVFNSVMITVLPMLFGNNVIWYTAGIAESITLVLAIALLKKSEQYGIVFA